MSLPVIPNGKRNLALRWGGQIPHCVRNDKSGAQNVSALSFRMKRGILLGLGGDRFLTAFGMTASAIFAGTETHVL